MNEYWSGFGAGFAICAIITAYLVWRVLGHEQSKE